MKFNNILKRGKKNIFLDQFGMTQIGTEKNEMKS